MTNVSPELLRDHDALEGPEVGRAWFSLRPGWRLVGVERMQGTIFSGVDLAAPEVAQCRPPQKIASATTLRSELMALGVDT